DHRAVAADIARRDRDVLQIAGRVADRERVVPRARDRAVLQRRAGDLPDRSLRVIEASSGTERECERDGGQSQFRHGPTFSTQRASANRGASARALAATCGDECRRLLEIHHSATNAWRSCRAMPELTAP